MDFKDQYCRAVFVIGVPFPPIMDPKVKGKEKYADSLYVPNPDSKKNEVRVCDLHFLVYNVLVRVADSLF